jgi:hypothetical protein
VEEALPAEMQPDHVMENHTRMPEVHLDGCICGNNRPRGFLLTTCKTVLVENCTFYNMHSGVESASDANDWFESGPVTDVTIRNNRFDNSAYAGGSAITLTPVVKTGVGKAFHRNILIENNHFRQHEKRFLYARFAENLVFRNNTYTLDETLPAKSPIGKSGIQLDNCINCIIEEPKEI